VGTFMATSTRRRSSESFGGRAELSPGTDGLEWGKVSVFDRSKIVSETDLKVLPGLWIPAWKGAASRHPRAHNPNLAHCTRTQDPRTGQGAYPRILLTY